MQSTNVKDFTPRDRQQAFAIMAAALADAIIDGQEFMHVVETIMKERAAEQSQVDVKTRLAAIARQIGDAAAQGRPLKPLLRTLAQTRWQERSGEVIDARRFILLRD